MRGRTTLIALGVYLKGDSTGQAAEKTVVALGTAAPGSGVPVSGQAAMR